MALADVFSAGLSLSESSSVLSKCLSSCFNVNFEFEQEETQEMGI